MTHNEVLVILYYLPVKTGRFVIGEFTRGSFFRVFFLSYDSGQIEVATGTCIVAVIHGP